MTDAVPTLTLQAGHDRRISGGHPWAYSNELRLDAAAKALPPGTLVRLARADGKSLGIASFNRNTLIAARLLLRDGAAQPAAIDGAFMEARIRAALRLREYFFAGPYYRLVHAEGDGLPGFIIDRFAETLVVQANTAGAEALTPLLLDTLDRVLAPQALVLRNDSAYRELEGLPRAITLARGSLPARVEVVEHGVTHGVEPLDGQKTGWFFDLHGARGLVAGLAPGGRVLDLCCNGGAFGLAALKAGAESAVLVDRAQQALGAAEASAAANGLADRARFIRADLFEEAERQRDAGNRYEVVVADPPSFAKSRKDVPQALRAYRKLARDAAVLVAPGGFLFIASCSHNIEHDAFVTEVARGIANAGRESRIIADGGAGPDHPVHPQLPETGYLKWLVLALD
ncbi:class I SAM-dependent rRNA methyltransferase [Zavarzinia compransoris]|uniref:RlmI/RlmK family 23S rRNA methyltransferase n=1 Tax=Zavarzinia compransoris TaxID=1264899 RepID=A0A317E1B0_9PROT|nr:class I SAM-dependent rRNA methyltransferase [Zavarzinia compransoris]PWR19906.1 RlmI/RlmK family 23S rRNA methyltransferase [Zavarzinia compransoris]TDP44980.1 SAM-dependent methyltransferase [Zavarzinia compransoris]